MYKVNKLKLFIIIAVFVFSALYLLPTFNVIYGKFYGHFEIWMQERIDRPQIEENSIKFDLSDTKLPEGTNFQEAINRMQIILESRLDEIGMKPGKDFEFDTTEGKEFLVKFTQEDQNVKKLYNKLQLFGSLPIVIKKIFPHKKLNLGLDLRGGVHLVLELDLEESKKALLADYQNRLVDMMRSEGIDAQRNIENRFGEDALVVSVKVTRQHASPDAREDYIQKVEKFLDELNFFSSPTLLSEKNDTLKYKIALDEKGLNEHKNEAIGQVDQVLRNRIDEFGVAEPSIRRQPNKPRIVVELPGAEDSSKPLKIVKTMGRLEFKLVEERNGSPWIGGANTPVPDEIPEDAEIRYGTEDEWYVLKKAVALSGDRIKRAAVRQQNYQLVVSLSFDSQGRKKFAEVTDEYKGKRLAIVLDGKVQSAPVIKDKIVGDAQIEGDFTPDEASNLAKILRAGAFPVGVKIAEERTVGPTLGKEAINNGIMAAIIGLTLVLIFMVIYYKLSGIIAVIALAFDMLIMLGALAGFGAALTLPGLAGLVLTIGMAVDANVLIFERIREELKTGKTVRSSIDSGYQKAFWTILDANVTTLLTALVLYQFGTGPIKGFAVTLSIGIAASMFTALIVTKEIYKWIYHTPEAKKISI